MRLIINWFEILIMKYLKRARERERDEWRIIHVFCTLLVGLIKKKTSQFD